LLSDRIKLYRVAKRLTQDELAEKLYVSTGYISEIETGRRTPSLPLLVKLFELLDCSPNDLFEYEDKKDTCDGCSYKNVDNTIAETVDMLTKLRPDEKHKVYNYVKDQLLISKVKTEDKTAN